MSTLENEKIGQREKPEKENSVYGMYSRRGVTFIAK